MTTSPDASTPNFVSRGRLQLLMHGAIIAVIGLVSGFGLVFVILDAVSVWPVTIDIGRPFPGSEHGWRVAHVAGVMNGIMMMVVGLSLGPIRPTRRASAWIVGAMVYTGWGNTLFFHCANFSSNRALSAGVTRFGDPDLVGSIGYLIGASTIPFTIAAFVLVALAANRQRRNHHP